MSNSLDLSRRKLELEQIFSSVINKIPDLCHPPAPLLAGEEDYFNKTKDLELVPFKKQEVFERCVTPTLDQQRHEAVSSPTSDFFDIERSTSSCSLPSRSLRSSRSVTPRDPSGSSLKQLKVSFLGGSGASYRRPASDQRKDATVANKASGGRHVREAAGQHRSRAAITVEAREKLEMRNRLHALYSRLKLKPRPELEETKRRQLECLNKISIGSGHEDPSRGAAYPFEDPMPECMLTRENMGNLRDIIVSATDIEWRMLTPVRPASEYEELYFDKLIQLHRNHYKYQVSELKLAREAERPKIGSSPSRRETAGLDTAIVGGKSRFRHTRHRSCVSPRSLQSQRLVADSRQHLGSQKSQVSMSLGMKLKGKFHARSSFASSGPMTNLNVPRLILTADGELDADDERDDGDETTVAAAIHERDNLQGGAPPLTASQQARTQAAQVQRRRGSLQNAGGAHVALETRGAVAIGKRREAAAADRDEPQC